LDSYYALTRHRQAGGMGISPISLGDIKLYSAAVGFASGEDFLWFADIMAELDQTYLEFQNQKAEQERAQQAAQRNAKRGAGR
jgi:hypothetical protein